MKQVVFSPVHTSSLKFSVRHALFVVCLLLMSSSFGYGMIVTPSPTQSSSSSLQSQSIPLTTLDPTPSPDLDPPYNCSTRTGPEGEDFNQFLIATNRVYLDISESVNCSGVIVKWRICHFIIGFRNATSSLSFCAWRSSNNSDEVTYEIVGCNTLTTIPGDGESFRCRQYAPKNPAEFLTVEEGDYIGFYVPDSGLLPALSVGENDENSYQMIRNVTGTASFLRRSELRPLSCTPLCGRALLKADIGKAFS